MARLRKFVCYRRIKRPNTRKSKYRKKSFVKTSPHCKVVKFNVGNLRSPFDTQVDLLSKTDLQIRDNALESARQTSTRFMEKKLGKTGFKMTIRVYPHHILREHALAAGAGADRFSSGMAHSFGKSVGNAAQISCGQPIMSIYVNKENISVARKALTRAKNKLPNSFQIVASPKAN